MRLKSGRFSARNNIGNLKLNKIEEDGLPRSQKEETPEWLRGRRIVEWEILLEQLEQCSSCENELNLKNTVSETIYGLGSILHVKCSQCKKITNVSTGKRHAAKEGTNSFRCFDVNTKLAAGKLDFTLFYVSILSLQLIM